MNNKMEQKKNAGRRMIALIAIALIATLLLSSIVSAAISTTAIKAKFSSAGQSIKNGKIGQYFSNYSSQTGPTFLDFFVFFVIFFSLCWMGLSQAFKDAGKGPIIGLSLALALAMSVALVWGGKFTLKKMFPFALAILFLGIAILIYSLLSKYVFKSESVGSKIAAGIIAVIITLILVYVLVSMVCSESRCANSPIFSKLFGADSLIGEFTNGVRDIIKAPAIQSSSTTAAGKVAAAGKASAQLAAGAAQQAGASADAPRDFRGIGGPETPWINTKTGQGITIAGSLVAIVALMLAFIFWQRKKQAEARKAMGASEGTEEKTEEEQKIFDRFILFIQKLLSSEKSRKEEFTEVKKELIPEGKEFSQAEHIAEALNQDVKDTIGEEIQKVQEAITEGMDFKRLRKHNVAEKKHVKNILEGCKKDANRIEEIEEELDHLNAVLKDYGTVDSVLDDMERLGFTKDTRIEHNELEKMKIKLHTLMTAFQQFSQNCQNMMDTIDEKTAQLKDFKEGKGFSSYTDLVQKVMNLRVSFRGLNWLFSQKVTLFKEIAHMLDMLDEEIHKIEDDEVEKLEKFRDIMDESIRNKKFDKAYHFAELIEQNADIYLQHEKRLGEQKRVKNEGLEGEEMDKAVMSDKEQQRWSKIKELLSDAKKAKEYCARMVHTDLLVKAFDTLDEYTDDHGPDKASALIHRIKDTADDEYKAYCDTLSKLTALLERHVEITQQLSELNRQPFDGSRIDNYTKVFEPIVKDDIYESTLDEVQKIGDEDVKKRMKDIHDRIITERAVFQAAREALGEFNTKKELAHDDLQIAIDEGKKLKYKRLAEELELIVQTWHHVIESDKDIILQSAEMLTKYQKFDDLKRTRQRLVELQRTENPDVQKALSILNKTGNICYTVLVAQEHILKNLNQDILDAALYKEILDTVEATFNKNLISDQIGQLPDDYKDVFKRLEQVIMTERTAFTNAARAMEVFDKENALNYMEEAVSYIEKTNKVAAKSSFRRLNDALKARRLTSSDSP